MRFQRIPLGRALSAVATMLLLGGCGLGAENSSPTAEALYPAAPVATWQFTAEDAGLPVDDPVLVDPRGIHPATEWVSSAAVIDLGDLWIVAVRSRSVSGDHRIVGISPETGEVVWSHAPESGGVLGCGDQLADGLLACATVATGSDPWVPTGVVLLDPATGDVRTQFDLPAGTRAWRTAGSALVAVVDTGDGRRLDRLTLAGEVTWSAELADIVGEGDGYECGDWLETDGESVTCEFCGHTWSVRLVDGVVVSDHSDSSVVLTRNGSSLVLDWGAGESAAPELQLVRGAEVLAVFAGYEQVRSLLESADSPVLLRGPLGDVVELDMETGLTTPTGIVAGSVDSLDRVGSRLIAVGGNTFFAHDAAQPGQVVWSYRVEDGGPSQPATDGALLYLLDGAWPDRIRLVAVRVSDGAVVWEVPLATLATNDPVTGEPPSLKLLGDRLVLAGGAGITLLETGDPSSAGGTEASRPVPVPPSAVGDGASLVAWGSDQYGEGGLPGVAAEPGVQVAAGTYHSLALREDGTVAAWGWNGTGQRAVPRGLSGVVDIAAGGFQSVALLEGGTVVSWGEGPAHAVPDGLDDVVAVSAGEEHTLALQKDGTVVAWGEDGYSQASVPADLTDVVEISAGGYHNLALRADGTVAGWGFNGSGRATPPRGAHGRHRDLRRSVPQPRTAGRRHRGGVGEEPLRPDRRPGGSRGRDGSGRRGFAQPGVAKRRHRGGVGIQRLWRDGRAARAARRRRHLGRRLPQPRPHPGWAHRCVGS